LPAILPNIVKHCRDFVCRERQNHSNIPVCYLAFGYICIFELVILLGPAIIVSARTESKSIDKVLVAPKADID